VDQCGSTDEIRPHSKPPVGPGDRHKSLSANRTIDTLKVDPPHFGGRNRLPTLRAHNIEQCLHFFEIDLPRPWHGPTTLIGDRNGAREQTMRPSARGDRSSPAARDFLNLPGQISGVLVFTHTIARSSIRERMLGGPGLLLHFARRGNSQPSPRKRSRPRRTLFALDLTQTSTLELHSGSAKVPWGVQFRNVKISQSKLAQPFSAGVGPFLRLPVSALVRAGKAVKLSALGRGTRFP
jgi:hypothetical protein